MIWVVLTIVLASLAGAALTRLLARDLHPITFAGTAILLGLGYAAMSLFFLSIVHLAWMRTTFVVALLLPAVTLLRRQSGDRRPATGDRRSMPFDAAILLLILGHAVFTTWAPMYEWDWFGIWGLKARNFFDAGGIDWLFIKTNVSHPDYPLMAPLLIDAPSVLRKAWEDQYVGLMYTALATGLILIARGLLAEEFESELWGSVATLAIACPALNLWTGLGEGPVAAFGCAGLLMARRGLQRASSSSLYIGAILLGFAAWSKNEGLSLTAMAIFATLLVSWRRAWRFWPAIAIAAVWIVTRATLHLQTDFMEGDVLGRVLAQLRHFDFFLRALFIYAPDLRLFWIACFATIILFARRAWLHERFLTVTLLLQAFLMAAQALATRAEIEWHIAYAWNRLPHQIVAAFGFLAVVLLFSAFSASPRETVSRGDAESAELQSNPLRMKSATASD